MCHVWELWVPEQETTRLCIVENHRKTWLRRICRLWEFPDRHSVTRYKSLEADSAGNKITGQVTRRIKKQAEKMTQDSGDARLRKGMLIRLNNMQNPDKQKNKLLTKKYTPNYSEETYRIVNGGKGLQYYLEDFHGHMLDSVFYSQDLLPISDQIIEPEPVKVKGDFWDREAHLEDLHSHKIEKEAKGPVFIVTPIKSCKSHVLHRARRIIDEKNKISTVDIPTSNKDAKS